MQITLKKGNVEAILRFINELKLSGSKVNRARFRFIELLKIKSKETTDERLEIAKSYANLNESGSPIILDSGNLDMPQDKMQVFNKAQLELFNEDCSLTVDDYKEPLDCLYQVLSNYDGDLQGDDLIAFGTVLDAMEKAGFVEKGEE